MDSIYSVMNSFYQLNMKIGLSRVRMLYNKYPPGNLLYGIIFSIIIYFISEFTLKVVIFDEVLFSLVLPYCKKMINLSSLENLLQCTRPCVVALIHADNDVFSYLIIILANCLFLLGTVLMYLFFPNNDFSFYHLAFMCTNGLVFWVLFFKCAKGLNKLIDEKH